MGPDRSDGTSKVTLRMGAGCMHLPYRASELPGDGYQGHLLTWSHNFLEAKANFEPVFLDGEPRLVCLRPHEGSVLTIPGAGTQTPSVSPLAMGTL
jgi:hypothetical protein